MKPDTTVIQIVESAYCCICLDCHSRSSLKLNCCQQFIHRQCFLLLMLNGHDKCPLCRKDIHVYNYFTETSLRLYYQELEKKLQDFYIANFQELLIPRRYVNRIHKQTFLLSLFVIFYITIVWIHVNVYRNSDDVIIYYY